MLFVIPIICFFFALFLNDFKALFPINLSTYIKVVFSLFIFAIIEESLFRSTLYHYTSHWSYYKELNAIIFGGIHIVNYYQNNLGFFKNLLSSINNIFFGYYLISLDNFFWATIIHATYNILIYTIITIYIMIFPNNNINNGLVPFKYDGTQYIYFNKLRRSKSEGSIYMRKLYNNSDNEYKQLTIKDKNIIEMFSKYNDIQNKRPKILLR